MQNGRNMKTFMDKKEALAMIQKRLKTNLVKDPSDDTKVVV
jgi:hypothetical protein